MKCSANVSLIANPLDYHTYIWANATALTDCYGAVLGSDIDVALLINDYPHPDRCEDGDWLIAERAFIDAHRREGNRPIVVATLPENFPLASRETLLAAGIAPMQGLDDCLSAIAGGRGNRRRPRTGTPGTCAGAVRTDHQRVTGTR